MPVSGWKGQRRAGDLVLGPPPTPDLAPALMVASGPEARHREFRLLQGAVGQLGPEGGKRRQGSHKGHWKELGGQQGARHRPPRHLQRQPVESHRLWEPCRWGQGRVGRVHLEILRSDRDELGVAPHTPPGPHCCALGLDMVSQARLGAPGRGWAWVLGQEEGASLCWQALCPAGRAGSRGTSRPAHQRPPSAVPVEHPLGGRTAPGGTRRCCRRVPGPAGPTWLRPWPWPSVRPAPGQARFR